MAGDWIKMREGLLHDTKLFGMSRHLVRNASFRSWLGAEISDEALRCVTCALLLRVWSKSREHGKFDGDDLVLAHLSIPDIDHYAQAPGVGKAMELVGWAKEKDAGNGGVILPNFRQHNAPVTAAEKQSQYRTRKKAKLEQGVANPERDRNVTRACNELSNKTVTREEKRREEEIQETHIACEAEPAALPKKANSPPYRGDPLKSLTVAKKLIEAYRNQVTSHHGTVAAESILADLLAFGGHSEEDVLRAIENYAQDCVRKEIGRQFRQSMPRWLQSGEWASYASGMPDWTPDPPKQERATASHSQKSRRLTPREIAEGTL